MCFIVKGAVQMAHSDGDSYDNNRETEVTY